MEIKEILNTKDLKESLFEIWKNSVRSTHLFLNEQQINEIAQYVPTAIENVKHLIVAFINEQPVGFIGVEEKRIEMLFIDTKQQGQGIGKQLIEYVIKKYQVNEVCVNEQNPKAKGFYEYMGFQVYKRTELDEQGKPYPLLYMKLDKNGNDLLNQY
ncbi:MAG: GNAT family N-acetyltransferase [Longibaculum sp.]